MNGVVGSWTFKGSRDTRARARELSHRLAFGAAQWRKSTPQLTIGETVGRADPPKASAAPKRVIIAADITLYDRPSLAAWLGLTGSPSKFDDRELVVRAYERSGEACFERLNGDFAIALFDLQQQRLILARDHSSSRPLYFRKDADGVDFCSMARPLALLSDGRARPDWDRWLRYHALLPEIGAESFFAGVERVEPGEAVAITEAGIRRWKHWSPPTEAIRMSYPEVIEEASWRLSAAVKDRRRGAARTLACQLSRGLDSSAALAFAADDGHRVLAFTGVPEPGEYGHLPPNRIADEGDVAAQTAAFYPSVKHRQVVATPEPLLSRADRWHGFLEQPLRSLQNYGWLEGIMDEASLAGANVLLRADYGNYSFSPFGYFAFSELLAERKFARWAKLAYRHWRNTPVSVRGVIAHSLPVVLPASLYRATFRAFGHEPPDNFHDAYLNADDPRVSALRDQALAEGWMNGSPVRDGRQLYCSAVSWNDYGNQTFGFRRSHGLEQRDPMSDRRLLELTLALPSEHFIHDGRPRSLARDILKGKVAPGVLDPVRGAQGQDWPVAFERSLPELKAEIERVRADAELRQLIDIERLAADAEAFTTDRKLRANALRYEMVSRTLGMTRFARHLGDDGRSDAAPE